MVLDPFAMVPRIIPGEEYRRYTAALGPAVYIDSHREAGKADTLWTYGLCGCTATLAFRGDRVQLAHYSPLMRAFHRAAVHGFRPERLIVIAPGDWVKTGDKWELVQREPWNIGEERVAYDMGVRAGERMDARMVQYIGGKILLPY